MNEFEKILKMRAWKKTIEALEADFTAVCMNPNTPQEERDLAWMENAALQRIKEKLEQKARL